MSEYKHRMTVIVPEEHIGIANHLALVAGEFPEDIYTFESANWQDSSGNKYAACSTVIKPVVLGMYGVDLSEVELPEFKKTADLDKAQQALDMVVMFSGEEKVAPDSIICAIDYRPLPTLLSVGLSAIETETDM